MLKVKVNCPICGTLILAKSLEGHLKRVHELTGLVTLRLHPSSPYSHEPEPEPVVEPEPEPPEEKPGQEEEPPVEPPEEEPPVE